MARRTEAYVDTSALIAFADRSDSHHPLFRRLFAQPPPLVTTPLVVAEGHGWFLRRFDQTLALQFMALVDSLSTLQVVTIGHTEVDGGSKLLRRYSDQALTLADAVGLHVMAERGTSRCWSTDRHLALSGVRLVIHES